MKIDTSFVSLIPLRSLVETGGIQLQGHAELYGPCPKCGGTDRFHIRRFGDRDWFFCRQCHQQRGDAIEYMRWLHGLSFQDAVTVLQHQSHAVIDPKPSPSSLRSTPPANEPPASAWQTSKLAEVNAAQDTLWRTATALQWLRSERGLNDQTIRHFKLGLIQEGRAAGITIPHFYGDLLWAVRTRLGRYARHGIRYMLHTGSKPCFYNAGALAKASTVLIVEGEFDCMLAQQEAPTSMAVVTLGSASSNPDRWAHLVTQKHILIATDNDAEGESIASKWMSCLGNVRRVYVPAGKDITEFWQTAGDIKPWLNNL
jgi:DNA primase